MLTYRRIETETKYRKTIWIAEQNSPQWFRDASAIWTPTYRSFIEFWRSCDEIWGLFDGDDLAAVVYLAFEMSWAVNIHVSVVKELPPDEITRFFVSLTRQKREDGVRSFNAWVLSKNRGLLRVAEAAGYRKTGLKMDYGAARGRVLRWVEIRC